MRYLLDANVIIGLLRDDRSPLARRARHERLEDMSTSSIVIHELLFGAFKSQRPASNLAIFDSLKFAVLDFDRDDARQAGLIRADLTRHGAPIGPYDVLIAGQAVARNLILVTRNTREFGRVSGLRIENWEA
ncbi:MAG TPA: type II toxin-antitoxin system VapC family toxin [Stellaceae bacterium]|nr:type II toxin-antitoxin system VapC family toxin [Stellaceae bacterium]